MTANRIFAEFSVVFCLSPYVLLVELNEPIEAPSVGTVLVEVTGSPSTHDTA